MHGRTHRIVLNARMVKLLVFAAQSEEDLLRSLLIRLLHHDGLEAACEGAVLGEVLFILAEGRRSDDLHLPTCEGRLQNVRRIQRALCAAGTDERMNLVDKENDILRFDDIIHDILETLLKLTAVFCSGDKGRHRQRNNAFVLKQERHLAVRDALSKPLGDGCLANARFPEKDGVVLRAPRENLNDTIDLSCTADDGIKSASLRNADQIAAKFFE